MYERHSFARGNPVLDDFLAKVTIKSLFFSKYTFICYAKTSSFLLTHSFLLNPFPTSKSSPFHSHSVFLCVFSVSLSPSFSSFRVSFSHLSVYRSNSPSLYFSIFLFWLSSAPIFCPFPSTYNLPFFVGNFVVIGSVHCESFNISSFSSQPFFPPFLEVLLILSFSFNLSYFSFLPTLYFSHSKTISEYLHQNLYAFKIARFAPSSLYSENIEQSFFSNFMISSPKIKKEKAEKKRSTTMKYHGRERRNVEDERGEAIIPDRYAMIQLIVCL